VRLSGSATKPNASCGSPPRGTFQSWAIPGGGDIVGNRDVSRDGNLIMANGLVNTVGLIEISGP